MRSRNRRSNIDPKCGTRRVCLELISFERPFSSQIEKENVLEYIQAMTQEMRDLSIQADLPFVAYLLDIVARETDEMRNGTASTPGV
jgi:hypothetical protein